MEQTKATLYPPSNVSLFSASFAMGHFRRLSRFFQLLQVPELLSTLSFARVSVSPVHFRVSACVCGQNSRPVIYRTRVGITAIRRHLLGAVFGRGRSGIALLLHANNFSALQKRFYLLSVCLSEGSEKKRNKLTSTTQTKANKLKSAPPGNHPRLYIYIRPRQR